MKSNDNPPINQASGRPRKGAWIEIVASVRPVLPKPRRPRKGAWIEISIKIIISLVENVAPARGRGLKFAAPAGAEK